MANFFNLKGEKLERANRLYRESIVIDALNPLYMTGGLRGGGYLKHVLDNGINVVHFTVTQTMEGWKTALEELIDVKEEIEETPMTLLATSIQDIDRAKKENKLAIIAGWQNAKPLEDNINSVRIAQELGIRIIQLAYHYQNYIGSGCGERNDYGLSRYGINVVRQMNRCGITIDLSHVGHRTVMDTIEYSEAPVTFTHANRQLSGITLVTKAMRPSRP